MNRVKSLITRLCPEGVPYQTLSDVTEIKRGSTITKSETIEGEIPVLGGGQKPAYYHNVSNRDGETIVIAGSGAYAGFVSYWNSPVFVSDAFTVAPLSSSLDTRFCFHFLKNLQGELHAMKSGGGVPHVYGKDVGKLRIPMPPLEVQNEIVKILEMFRALEAELERELESRYLQMRHYSQAMTEIFSKDELTTLALAEFAEIGTGSRNTQDAIPGAEYPFYVRSQTPLSIDQFEFDEQAVLTAGDGVGVGKVFHFADGKYALHQRAYRIKPNNSIVDTKFLFYFMKNNFGTYLDSTAVHASVTSLRRPMFEKFEVTFPSLKSQRKIVHFLDLLEAYIGDQNGGIHAELNARRKQYEYYRSTLLSFKELVVS